MCGVTGFYSRASELPKSLIEEMTCKIKHRGPDAQGVFVHGNKKVALGHRRLSIIDLSDNANQPMTSKCGKYTIVFNGEVYNFEALREELKTEFSADFETSSDTEVLLQAYINWGETFILKLNGMFAIAIYDEHSDKLFLARDRMGIKPFYYYEENGVFAFASELKSLTPFAKQFKKFSINQNAVNLYFRLGYIPAPHTIYNEVKKFPTGTYAFYSQTGFDLKKYWDLENQVEKKVLSDESKAKKQLNGLLCDSVKLRLKSDVPFGVFLSGGVDSSTVAAVAQQVSPTSISTFSIGFNEAKYNESEHAEKVADYLKTNHSSFVVSHKDAQDLMGDLQVMFDEPFADASAIPTFLVSKLARNQVKMVLTGDGGDEQFLGYGMYNWAKRLDNKLLKMGRNPIKLALKSSGKPRLKRVADVFDFDRNTELMSHIFSTEQYLFSAASLKDVLKKQEQSVVHFETPELLRTLKPMERQAFFDLNYYLKDDLLVKVDRASMKASLEARVPLLDHRIIEFALNVDPALKYKDGVSKYLLKEVMYNYLPKQLMERPKWGFGLPIRIWLAKELRPFLENYLSESRLKKVAFLNTKGVLQLKKRYLMGEDQLYNKLWLVIMFLQWYELNESYFDE